MTRDHEESYELLTRSSSDSGDLNGSIRNAAVVWESSATFSQRVSGTFRKIWHLQNPFSQRRSYQSNKRRVSLCNIAIVRLLLRLVTLTIGFLFMLSVLRAIIFPSYQNPPAHYDNLRQAVEASNLPRRGNPYNEKIFIAANILQENLIRGAWGESVLELIDLLGPDNVFLSIYENDSGPGTVQALKELRSKLQCENDTCPSLH